MDTLLTIAAVASIGINGALAALTYMLIAQNKARDREMRLLVDALLRQHMTPLPPPAKPAKEADRPPTVEVIEAPPLPFAEEPTLEAGRAPPLRSRVADPGQKTIRFASPNELAQRTREREDESAERVTMVLPKRVASLDLVGLDYDDDAETRIMKSDPLEGIEDERPERLPSPPPSPRGTR